MPTTITPCVVLIGDLPDQVLALQDLVQDGEVIRIEDPRQVAASAQGKDIMHRPKEQLLFVVFDDGHPAPKRLSGLGYHVVLVSGKPGLESNPDGCLWVCPNDVSMSELGRVIQDAGFGELLPAEAAITSPMAPTPTSPDVEHIDLDTPNRTVADFLAAEAQQQHTKQEDEEDSPDPTPTPDVEPSVGLGALMDAPLDPSALVEPPQTTETPPAAPPTPPPVAPGVVEEPSVGLGALMDAPLDPSALVEPPQTTETPPAAPPTPLSAPPTIVQPPVQPEVSSPILSPSTNGHHETPSSQDNPPETLSLEALLGGGVPDVPAPALSSSPIDELLAPGLDGFSWGSPVVPLEDRGIEETVAESPPAAPDIPTEMQPTPQMMAPPPPPPPPPPAPQPVVAPPPMSDFDQILPVPEVEPAVSSPPPVNADEDAFVRDLLGGGGMPVVDPAPTLSPQPVEDLWTPQHSVPAVPARFQPNTGHGKIIFTLVPKGGTGKTTFTTTLSAWAAQVLGPLGQSIALLDGNLQQGNVLRLTGLPAASPTLYQVAREPVIDQDVVQRITLRSPRYPLDLVVPSNLATHRVEEIDPKLITPQLYRKVAQRLAETHNYVFVDTQVAEVHSDMMREFILPTADFLMVVLDHDQSAADQTIPTLQLISSPRWRPGGSAIDATKMGIVLNRFNPAAKLTQADLRAQLASWLWMGTVPYYQELKDAADRGELWFGDDLVPRLNQILWHVTGDWAFRGAGDEEHNNKKKPKRNPKSKTNDHQPAASSNRKWYSFLVPSKD